jgi:pimeloyl-ACP methyl ester carboxylesterase
MTIIGHSRGGMLGKALASRLGSRCSGFVALGSPLGAILRAGPEGLADMAEGRSAKGAEPAAEAVATAGRRAMRVLSPRCEFPRCGCRYQDELFAPWLEPTRLSSLYSIDDPVVPARASRIDGAVNIEVVGSHSGLVVNRHLYRHLGAVLAGNI